MGSQSDAMRPQSAHLTSGHVLARNTIWNLLGQVIPMVFALVTIPLLVHGLGMARFGVLSLAWIVIGYFSLFDLGIGRAMTKLVSDKLALHEDRAIPPLAWTPLLLMFLLGTLGGAVMFASSHWLITSVLKVPPDLRAETLHTFYLLAVSIPLVTTTSGLRGILEALQLFQIVNLIRIPMSIFSFSCPLLVLPFSDQLPPVIMVVLVGRLVGCAAHLLACFHALPALRGNFRLDCSIILPVVKFGGFMTISNVIGPIMVYLDRFLIGALLALSAVPYYTAPFDAVIRLSTIPTAAAGVLFPAFTVTFVQNTSRTELLLQRATKYIYLAVFPVALAIVVFAPEGLRVWLGPSFAANGGAVLRWLAAGVFVNSLTHVPFALIQSAGRPDITAKMHLMELPLYLTTLWLLTMRLGIQGAAIAWTSRITVDACLIWFFAQRRLPRGSTFFVKVAGKTGTGLLVLYAGTLATSVYVRGGFLVAILLLFAAVSWTTLLAPEERALLLRRRMAIAAHSSNVVEPPGT